MCQRTDSQPSQAAGGHETIVVLKRPVSPPQKLHLGCCSNAFQNDCMVTSDQLQVTHNKSEDSKFEQDVLTLFSYIDDCAGWDHHNRIRNRKNTVKVHGFLLLGALFLFGPFLMLSSWAFSCIPTTIIDDIMWEAQEPTFLGVASKLVVRMLEASNEAMRFNQTIQNMLLPACVSALIFLVVSAHLTTAFYPVMSSNQLEKMFQVKSIILAKITKTKHKSVLFVPNTSIPKKTAMQFKKMETRSVSAILARINDVYSQENPIAFAIEKRVLPKSEQGNSASQPSLVEVAQPKRGTTLQMSGIFPFIWMKKLSPACIHPRISKVWNQLRSILVSTKMGTKEKEM